MHELRRTVPRQPVDWTGWYVLDDDPGRVPHPCHVVDVSTSGAGLALAELPLDAEGRQITVTVELRGSVRSVACFGNQVRIGVAFDDVSGEAGQYLASQERLGVRW